MSAARWPPDSVSESGTESITSHLILLNCVSANMVFTECIRAKQCAKQNAKLIMHSANIRCDSEADAIQAAVVAQSKLALTLRSIAGQAAASRIR